MTLANELAGLKHPEGDKFRDSLVRGAMEWLFVAGARVSAVEPALKALRDVLTDPALWGDLPHTPPHLTRRFWPWVDHRDRGTPFASVLPGQAVLDRDQLWNGNLDQSAYARFYDALNALDPTPRQYLVEIVAIPLPEKLGQVEGRVAHDTTLLSFLRFRALVRSASPVDYARRAKETLTWLVAEENDDWTNTYSAEAREYVRTWGGNLIGMAELSPSERIALRDALVARARRGQAANNDWQNSLEMFQDSFEETYSE